MSGYQPDPYPASNLDYLAPRTGYELDDSPMADGSADEREPMGFGEKVGLVFLVIASVLVALGGLRWIINNCFGA